MHLRIYIVSEQDGVLDKDGLEKTLKKANEQLEKGNKFIQNVLAPAAKLSSSWTKVNIVCFPHIAIEESSRLLGWTRTPSNSS